MYYHDDVTKEAVDKVRKRAKPQLDKADLELVDGLGQYSVPLPTVRPR